MSPSESLARCLLSVPTPSFCTYLNTTVCLVFLPYQLTMTSEDVAMNLTFTHRGTTLALSLLPDATLAYLNDRLEELTSVPPENQKLLYKGKKAVGHDSTLSEAGLKNGMKVQLIGPTADELGGLKATESEHQRKERILRERAQKAPIKVRFFLSLFIPTRRSRPSTRRDANHPRMTPATGRPAQQAPPRSRPPIPATPSTASSRSRTSRTPTRRAHCSPSSRATPRSAT